MPEIKDIINYVISSISIIVTGIFSFLVWKATQKSNQVAQESYKLSQSIINSQQQLKSNIKDEFIRSILLKATEVLEILKLQNSGANIARMRSIPRNCGLTEIQLAEYFKIDEKDLINSSWDVLNEYLDRFWTDKNGDFKGTFFGNELNYAITATTDAINSFNALVVKLEKMKAERSE